MNFSLVIPVYNESSNIDKLIIETYESLTEYNDFELIVVNDASTDNSLEIINQLRKKFNLKLITNNINRGQSFSIYKGITESAFDTIVTLDGDGQNNPRDIPKLLKIYFSQKEIDMVGGLRKNRKDNLIKIISSKIANKIRSLILQDQCMDTGCSLKVFNKKIFLKFPFFDGIHRFLPALFKGYGGKICFIDVDHRPRLSGVSKYGTIGRLFRGIRDIFKVMSIINKAKKNV